MMWYMHSKNMKSNHYILIHRNVPVNCHNNEKASEDFNIMVNWCNHHNWEAINGHQKSHPMQLDISDPLSDLGLFTGND